MNSAITKIGRGRTIKLFIAVPTDHERAYYCRTVKVTTWGAGKKPSTRGQCAAAKAARAEKPNTQRKKKDRGER